MKYKFWEANKLPSFSYVEAAFNSALNLFNEVYFMRYFFVSYIERSGEYEFITNNVMQTKSTRADATARRMIKSQYDDVEVEYDKIIVNSGDICISHINVQQVTKEEYDILSKFITHI